MAHFALSKPDPVMKGKTRLQILEDIRKQTGVVAPQLRDLPRLPDETAHIWEWFCDLSRRRRAGEGLSPIAVADAAGYFDLMRCRPEKWEAQALFELDDAYLSAMVGPTVAVAGAGALKSAVAANTRSANG